jgi:hypothetical protein
MLYILPRTLCIVSEHVVSQWWKGSLENKHLMMDVHELDCDPTLRICVLYSHIATYTVSFVDFQADCLTSPSVRIYRGVIAAASTSQRDIGDLKEQLHWMYTATSVKVECGSAVKDDKLCVLQYAQQAH